jgi:hypothetical protein
MTGAITDTDRPTRLKARAHAFPGARLRQTDREHATIADARRQAKRRHLAFGAFVDRMGRRDNGG